MCWCSDLGAVSQIRPIQQPFLGNLFCKSFFWPQKRWKKLGNLSGSCVLSGHGRREQGGKVLLASRIWEENPSKQCLKPCLDFFSKQLSGSSGFYIFLSRWEFSPASSTGTLGFSEAFESREIAQPIFRLIDFCGWLKRWQDHSGKCMNSVKSWDIQAFFF